MCLPLMYICGAVICCSSAHHPFVQMHNNRGVDLGKGNAELRRYSDVQKILYSYMCWPFSLSCSHQKAFAHSAALLDPIAVLIDSTTVTGLYNKLCRRCAFKAGKRACAYGMYLPTMNVKIKEPCFCTYLTYMKYGYGSLKK